MNFILSFLGKGLVSIFGDAILKPILSHLDAKAAANRDIVVAQTGADKDRDIALVEGQVEANKLKAGSQAAYPFIVYMIAVPPALHAAGIYLDSLPFWTPFGAHVVGAWGVPKPPEPYDDWQGKILLSFFVVAPVVQAIRAGTAAIARR